MFQFIAFGAIVVLFVQLAALRSRLKQAEDTLREAAKRIGALQRLTGLLPPKPGEFTPGQMWTAPEEPPAPEPTADALPPEPIPTAAPVAADPEAPTLADRISFAKPDPEPRPEAPRAETPKPWHPAPAAAPRSMASRFEELFGQKLPIWAGGITLAIAGVLIVKYAADAGFFARVFTHGVQIVAGILFGLGLIASAEFAWRNQDRVRDVRVPQALSGAGIATLYAATLVAANVYALIGPGIAFGALAAITAAALGLSLRFGAPSALLGLVGGLAAPALVGAVAPNVPLLSVYLGLTIAALVGVSRTRRWPWLALAALLGGAGWSLWLMLANNALDTIGSLSVGGFVLLLALALPVLAFDGPRGVLLRAASAVIGALQLALLVACGGFSPLHWGLFALIAAAGQFLAWRDRAFASVPTVGLALAVLLLAIWPAPAPFWFATIGLSLAAIHALPLLVRLWQVPAHRQPTLELCGLVVAAPLLAKWHYPQIANAGLALIALGAATLPALAIALGWQRPERHADSRFALLTATAAALLALAAILLVAHWQAPLAMAVMAAAVLAFGKAAGDGRIEGVAAGFAAASLPLLVATMDGTAELSPLLLGAGTGPATHAVMRWGGLALLALAYAIRARSLAVQRGGQVAAALLVYGTLAQVVPARWLMLVPPTGGAVLLLAARQIAWERLRHATATLAALAVGWAFLPLLAWFDAAALSLAGIPMTLDPVYLGPADVIRRLALPAALFGAALWQVRDRLTREGLAGALTACAIVGTIALHCFYRLGFANRFGSDFVTTGLGQRLGWEALLIGGGWLALRRSHRRLALGLAVAGTAHNAWYTLLLHDPLWTAQAAGPLPLANLLAPAFAMLPPGLILLGRLWTDRPAWTDRAFQLVMMVLVGGFAWATLRQGFHPALLVDPGVLPAENILRSLLLLALAIGYLLWGIHAGRHDWRIASLVLMLGAVGKVFLFDARGLEGLLRIGSFVALGFSLIGIGWLYSRQLALPPDGTAGNRP
ncbi:MAG: DUF2339 domain-containing protein [Sphingomonadales bacterium]|nr:DUF2339 domain-containing protein [Sphingomonadales bacterium]